MQKRRQLAKRKWRDKFHRLTMAETDAAAPERVDESMSVEDVVAFLGSHGIPGRFCEAFEGNATVRGSVGFFHNLCLLSDNYIDGAEFLTLTESEVKAIIPPIGLARKVMRLLPQREVTIASVLGFNREVGQDQVHHHFA